MVLLWGEGRGPYGFGPHGREGEARVYEKHQSPQLGPGHLSVVPWAEAPEEAVFPEAGPSLRGMAPGGIGGRSFRNQALLCPPLGPSGGSGSQLYLTHCDPLLPH